MCTCVYSTYPPPNVNRHVSADVHVTIIPTCTYPPPNMHLCVFNLPTTNVGMYMFHPYESAHVHVTLTLTCTMVAHATCTYPPPNVHLLAYHPILTCMRFTLPTCICICSCYTLTHMHFARSLMCTWMRYISTYASQQHECAHPPHNTHTPI